VIDGTSTEEAQSVWVVAGTFCYSTPFPKEGGHTTPLGVLRMVTGQLPTIVLSRPPSSISLSAQSSAQLHISGKVE